MSCNFVRHFLNVHYLSESNFPRTKEILFSYLKGGQPTILLKY